MKNTCARATTDRLTLIFLSVRRRVIQRSDVYRVRLQSFKIMGVAPTPESWTIPVQSHQRLRRAALCFKYFTAFPNGSTIHIRLSSSSHASSNCPENSLKASQHGTKLSLITIGMISRIWGNGGMSCGIKKGWTNGKFYKKTLANTVS